MRKMTEFSVASIGLLFASVTPAVAGIVCVPAAPAPVIGLGIPALAAFGLAYRQLRKRSGK